MPIYEYRCGACGFQKEFLQRLNEKPLAVCPECGKRALNKMVTAAGFQLKGTGWYATDFRGGTKSTAGAGGSDAKTADGKTADGKTADAKTDKPAAADKTAAKDSSKSAPATKPSAASTTDSSN
jgi:putative FmdB family regulatory protein